MKGVSQMIRRFFSVAAAVVASGSAFAHDSVVPHAHPHGIDTVIATLALATVFGLLWYLGLPPFERRALREIRQEQSRRN